MCGAPRESGLWIRGFGFEEFDSGLVRSFDERRFAHLDTIFLEPCQRIVERIHTESEVIDYSPLVGSQLRPALPVAGVESLRRFCREPCEQHPVDIEEYQWPYLQPLFVEAGLARRRRPKVRNSEFLLIPCGG